MVHVVNVCDETLRKRLEEFKQTNVAKLTRDVHFIFLMEGIRPIRLWCHLGGRTLSSFVQKINETKIITLNNRI